VILLKVSVIIVSRDRRKLLKIALLAVLNQRFHTKDYEVILIDDGSTDGTKDMVADLQKKYENMRYFAQDKKGPAAGRNLGIKKSIANLVAFTDSDAVADANWLVNLIKPFEDKKVLGSEGKTVTPKKKKLFHTAPECLHGNKFMTCNMAFRKSVLNEVGGFDEELVIMREDADLAFKVLRQGKIVFVPNAVVRHPLRRNSYLSLITSLSFNRNDIIVFRRFPKEYLRFFGSPFKKPMIFSVVSWFLFAAMIYFFLLPGFYFLLILSVLFVILWKVLQVLGKDFNLKDLIVFLPLSFLRDLLFPFVILYYSSTVPKE